MSSHEQMIMDAFVLQEIEEIRKENEELKEMLTPDMNDAIDLQHKINDFNK